MSSDYTLYEDERYCLSLWEGSSQFSIMAFDKNHEEDIDIPCGTKGRLTGEEIIEIAAKMLKVLTYNGFTHDEVVAAIAKGIAY